MRMRLERAMVNRTHVRSVGWNLAITHAASPSAKLYRNGSIRLVASVHCSPRNHFLV